MDQAPKHGLLLNEMEVITIISCLDYKAQQIKQEQRATGKVTPENRSLLVQMSGVRNRLGEIAQVMGGVEKAGALIEGEKVE